jgi:hypothetical protein
VVWEAIGSDDQPCSQSAGLPAPRATSACLRTQMRRRAVRHPPPMRPVIAPAASATSHKRSALVKTCLVSSRCSQLFPVVACGALAAHHR